MRGMATLELYSGFSSGSYGAVVTQQVNFGRSNVALQTSVSGGYGSGTHKAGIAAFQGAAGTNFGDRQTVETVFIEPGDLRRHAMYKIDPQTRKLIAMPLETLRK